MALKKSKLSQIPPRNKDLAFGYVREPEKMNNMLVPEMIKYLCLIYFNPTDVFDPDQCDEKIEINGDSIIGPRNYDKLQTVYLKNVVSSGVHEWKFEYKGDNIEPANGGFWIPDMIGIFNMDYKHLMIRNENHYFDNYWKDGKNISRGFGLASNAKLTNAECPELWGKEYGHKWRKGDTIVMKLDFNSETLIFTINDNNYGDAFQIDATKQWKAAITFGQQKTQCEIKLISYQKFY